MAWDTSNRASRLPANWKQIRERVLRRDNYACQWVKEDGSGKKCYEPADEVDHIVPGDNHAMTNLRALCHHHHAKKTGREGTAARVANMRRVDSRYRRTEQHPGML
ncbi:HNH endonuclease [Micromonospora sp. NPDC049836]|uniref:HNH endonuclease n=1 Tax=Micromonospora sp. NPDC049836 TaxID=3364274 RepID=UPI0037B1168A